MKNVNRILVAIAISCCSIVFGQTDTLENNITKKHMLSNSATSSSNKNQPLYILDGKPIDNKEFQSLKPETIESITILKDTAATALYAAKGNGVIIIKTKKNSKKEIR